MNATEVEVLGIAEGIGVLLGCAFLVGVCARVLLCK